MKFGLSKILFSLINYLFCLGLLPSCVVLVATARALKMHGGGPKVLNIDGLLV